MTQDTHHPLLSEVTAHCAARNMSFSAFGEKAVGDPRFVFDLQSGREPRRVTVRRVREFMSTGRTWGDVRAERQAGAA